MLDRNIKLPIRCPNCKKQIQESIARLEKNPTLTCRSCGSRFRIEGKELRRALSDAEKVLAEFKRKIGAK